MSLSQARRRSALILIVACVACSAAGDSALARDAVASAPERCDVVQTGTAGSDELVGTGEQDRLSGGLGKDSLRGLKRADCLHGGARADLVIGGDGGDRITGGLGADRVRARDGSRDRIRCGRGDDVAQVDYRDRVRGCERVRRAPAKAGRARGKGPGPDPAPDPQPAPDQGTGCEPDPANLLATGCSILFQDSGANADVASVWGSLDCEAPTRYRSIGGGDPHLTSAGLEQASPQARELTVRDGDDVWGERCEIGKNDHRTGPTAVYREGSRELTFLSVRLDSDFPLGARGWQVVAQMKQAQPSANGGGTPVLALHAYDGRWRLMQSTSAGPSSNTRELWSTAAVVGRWTRFAFDIKYSQDPDEGAVRVYVDLNGDGDASDPGEQSPLIQTYTLKYETSGGIDDGIAPGESIPSHLRVGPYHDTSISCPGGCTLDVDNVQVVKTG